MSLERLGRATSEVETYYRLAPWIEAPEASRLSTQEIATMSTDICIPLLTIFGEDGRIDLRAHKVHVKQAAKKAKILFGGGTSGGLGKRYFTPEHTRILTAINDQVRKEEGRNDMLVYFGVKGSTVEEALEFAAAGFDEGGDVAIATSPYCFFDPKTSRAPLRTGSLAVMHEDTLDFFQRFGSAIGKDRCFGVYNMPGPSWERHSMPPELLDEIYASVPNAILSKDSSRTLLTHEYSRVAYKHTQIRGVPVASFLGFFPTPGALYDGQTEESKAKGGVPVELNGLGLAPLVQWELAKAGKYDLVVKVQEMDQLYLNLVVGGLKKEEFPELVRGPIYYAHLNGVGEGYMPPGLPSLESDLKRQIQQAWEMFSDEGQMLLDLGIPLEYISRAEAIKAERENRAKETAEGLDMMIKLLRENRKAGDQVSLAVYRQAWENRFFKKLPEEIVQRNFIEAVNQGLLVL